MKGFKSFPFPVAEIYGPNSKCRIVHLEIRLALVLRGGPGSPGRHTSSLQEGLELKINRNTFSFMFLLLPTAPDLSSGSDCTGVRDE